jgi:hypothetical protein
LINCRLTGNRALPWVDDRHHEGFGGGAYECRLFNCVLSGNSARFGGAVYGGRLFHCTIVENSTEPGGEAAGVYQSHVENSIVWGNGPGGFFNNWSSSYFVASCTEPLPSAGSGNIAANPSFVNFPAGDHRLAPGSPCIDAGTHVAPEIHVDADGLPRVLDGNGDGIGVSDMGAYEFNPYRFTSFDSVNGLGQLLTLQAEPGRLVRIDRSTNLVHWEPWFLFEAGVGQLELIDPASGDPPIRFYRAVRQ